MDVAAAHLRCDPARAAVRRQNGAGCPINIRKNEEQSQQASTCIAFRFNKERSAALSSLVSSVEPIFLREELCRFVPFDC